MSAKLRFYWTVLLNSKNRHIFNKNLGFYGIDSKFHEICFHKASATKTNASTTGVKLIYCSEN